MWWMVDKLFEFIDSSVEGHSISSISEENNGGATDYYATPKNNVTLNDLIEYKQMEFWRGEIFKASYAIEGRVEKNTEKCPILSELREVNKILYY